MICVLLFLAVGPAGGWQPLFGELPEGAEGWRLEGGVLHALPGSPLRTADLYTPAVYSDFEFEVEFRVAPGGNSGIRYLPLLDGLVGVLKPAGVCVLAAGAAVWLLRRRPWLALLAGIWCLSPFAGVWWYLRRHPLALEFQVLDNERHRDGRRGGLYRAGALYGLSPAREEASRPAGEWNQARVAVNGSRIEHWLNGRLVVSVDMGSAEHQAARGRFYGRSWYRIFREDDWRRLGWKRPSAAGLQHHGEEVWYRSARIRALNRN